VDDFDDLNFQLEVVEFWGNQTLVEEYQAFPSLLSRWKFLI
jgi:hypothetical protein